MISQKQREDWQALVNYLKLFGNGACINSLLEDGPEEKIDYAGLLERYKEIDNMELI